MEGGQLGLAFDVQPLVRVTPARLATWADCPRRYRMTYLDRPPAPRGGAWARNTLGAVVHLALRALFERPPADRTPRNAAELVDRHWTGEGFRDDTQAARYRERARGWVADYAARPAPGPDEEPAVGLEQWVSATTGRLVAQGRVDRIDRRGADLVIVDYKTGSRPPTPADAGASQALALYAVATEHTLRRRCARVELHHLPSGTVAGWDHDGGSLRAHLERAERTAGELSAAAGALDGSADRESPFPARPAPRCATCPVRRSCPEGRAAAPEQVPWAGLEP